MIKTIVFDLDGTLCSTKQLHYDALNAALEKYAPEYVIEHEDHLQNFDGLPTTGKLQILVARGMDENQWHHINDAKQAITREMLETHDFGVDHSELFNTIITNGFTLALCTNSIKESTMTVLRRLHLQDKFSLIVTNEDIVNAKPYPDMYRTVIDQFHMYPYEVLVIEDSDKGVEAGLRSGASVWRVDGPEDLTIDHLQSVLAMTKDKPLIHTPPFSYNILTELKN